MRSPLLPRAGTPIVAAFKTPSGGRVSVHGVVCWNTARLDTAVLDTCGFGVRVTRRCSNYVGFVHDSLASACVGPEQT